MLLTQHFLYFCRNRIDRTNTFDTMILRTFEVAIKSDQRLGLFGVDLQAMTHGVFFVIVSLDQRLTGLIINTGYTRWIVFDVIHTS